MAIHIFNTDDVDSGFRANLGSSDDVYVEEGVTVGSTDSIAIYGTHSNHSVSVDGKVIAQNTAILLGDNFNDSDQFVSIGKTGVVHSFGTAVGLFGTDTEVQNAGKIWAAEYGVMLAADGGGESTIVNTGDITSSKYGIYRLAGTDTFKVTNSGTINAVTAFLSSGDAVDMLTNTGRINGNVFLGGEDDLYFGSGGSVKGNVDAGDGNDILRGGNSRDIFFGGNGDDDMSGGKAIDALIGQDGADTLEGGLGKDILAGGANGDSFIFNTKLNKLTNVDTIVDFFAPQDVIHLEKAIFKKLGAGVLSNTMFKVGAQAADANDYIVYDRAKGALFYDADGNGAGAQIQFATLSSKPLISSLDFLVI